MKSILMPIKPEWLSKILNGKKTIELRKRFPKDYRGWVYCYCTLGKPYLYECALYSLAKEGECAFVHNDKDETAVNFLSGKVVCRFWVDNVDKFVYHDDGYSEPMFIQENGDSVVFDNYKPTSMEIKSCVEFEDWVTYSHNKKFGNESKYNPILAIHISKLEIFNKPKDLTEFHYYKKRLIDCGRGWPLYFDEVKTQVRKAPQSWQYIYIEEDK